jgi:hypothetical protein
MKRWLVGILLAALAGVLLVVAIDSKRDPIAILERHGGKIERNEQGGVGGYCNHPFGHRPSCWNMVAALSR